MESGPNGSRPMLELQPRSALLPAGSDDDAQPKQAARGAGQRPKLQLQPRSKPLDNGSSRQSTLFGAARPREEILKVRAQRFCQLCSAVSQSLEALKMLCLSADLLPLWRSICVEAYLLVIKYHGLSGQHQACEQHSAFARRCFSLRACRTC